MTLFGNTRHWLCRLGLHKKRFREGYFADRTFLLIGVILYECERCDWRMKDMGES